MTNSCGNEIPEGRQICPACEEKPNKLAVSETLIIGYDESPNGDLSALSVLRRVGFATRYVKTFYGKEAEEMYAKLTSFPSTKRE